ncbi:thioredoxin domain-containing protein [Novosphingobium sp. FSY-8]|uniref:Thioredoxin domain-containing protein n=1 Tax=Novosphingobium ovatum TaxID=1908523 RepID=A0ABW9XBH7_9SPHN|nr:thioredoxin domain-containing protein [Novosphingobium ovatum]NBC35850.1 thioredoxin domain-containing protein [Novosphingobium ovatum]
MTRMIGFGLGGAMIALGLTMATPAPAAPAKPAPAKPAPAKPGASTPRPGKWLTVSAMTPAGTHVLGNPQAPVKLAEFMSYTCPHCAHFEAEGATALKLNYIPTGRVSYEVRHLLRDPVDLTVALLVHCAPPAKFFDAHNRFLASQDKWLEAIRLLSKAQMSRWENGETAQRLRAIASDLKFYDTIARYGVTRAGADRCLADNALQQKLIAQTKQAIALNITGTPGFLINGQVAANVYDWGTLEPLLKAQD